MADEMWFQIQVGYQSGDNGKWQEIFRAAGVTDEDINAMMGIGNSKCENYDRICYVINRDEQRRELWKEVTSWQLSNHGSQREVPTSRCERDGLE